MDGEESGVGVAMEELKGRMEEAEGREEIGMGDVKEVR